MTDTSARPLPATPFYLAIAGNIGVGKSMVTELIGRTYGWRTFYEPVIDNPYLDDYYADMRRWAFQLQIYFLSKRFEVQKAILDDGGPAVQDRTIYEDVEIFAPTLHRRGCIDDRDYASYREIFANMTAFLRAPDLILYLRATPDTTIERIRQRGRTCEQGVPRDFIVALHEAYEAWLGRATALCPVETIDTETVNLRDDESARRGLFALIDRHQAARRARGQAAGESR
jgi:deoxyadenosine/deoxycytidine kinase